MASRVVHIIDHMALGGVQTFLLTLLPALRSHAIDSHVINLRSSTAVSDSLHATGVPVHHLDLPRWSPRQYSALVQRLRVLRPDIVHTHLTVGNLVGRAAAIRACVPHIVLDDQVSISQEMREVPAPIVLANRLAEPYLEPHTDVYISASQIVQQASRVVRGWPAAKCYVVPNTIDCTVFRPTENKTALRTRLGLAEHRPTVLTMGRMVPAKRFGDVLKVARKVIIHQPDVQFLLAGYGPLATDLAHQIEATGLHRHVTMLGYRRDTAALLAASDIYLSVSGGEVFSLAILEAMASGCAIVATRAGGTAEQVLPGHSGFLANIGDNERLADSIIHLLALPALREQFGAHARTDALRRFDVPIIAQRMATIYHKLTD